MVPALLRTLAASITWLALAWPAAAQPVAPGDALIVEARDALRRGDRARLASAKAAAARAEHPLAMWPDYWDLRARLAQATVEEVEAFYARWPGSYVEDRLRNDWLLELGRRRDWSAFARDLPRFRMNDDREVACYALLLRHQAGEDVRAEAMAAWLGQRELDDGCQHLGATLHAAGRLTNRDVWRRVMQATDGGRQRPARAAAALLGADVARAVDEIFDSPARYLARRAPTSDPTSRQLGALALMRMAVNDPLAARERLDEPWARALGRHAAAGAWGSVARWAALKQLPEAPAFYRMALAIQGEHDDSPELSDDTLAWGVRAALRAGGDAEERWTLVLHAIDAMSERERADPAWVYWRARALQARAAPGRAGDAGRSAARRGFESIASPLHFYGKLALDALGREFALPPAPPGLTAAERAAAADHPGLRRGLQLIGLGLRSEGVREWNFSLIGMDDRALLAAAQLACDRAVWDRCINTSERTREQIDLAQRFPTPFRDEVLAATREVGVDPAYVYGLIRQESRFVTDARSHVGAAGLMQVMPGTARWTARRIGFEWQPSMANDRAINLRLGTTYLRLVLEDFEGSAPMAAAAYNAGPNRPRRWREGPPVEPAAWAEAIPFNETRDYVKKVLSNATVYTALMRTAEPSLRARLGPTITPRAPQAQPENKDLP